MSENQGIPDKEPTRDEVRATLTSHAEEYEHWAAHEDETVVRDTYLESAALYRHALALLDTQQPARFAVDCSTCGGRHSAHFSQCASDWGDLVCDHCAGIILTYDILPEVP